MHATAASTAASYASIVIGEGPGAGGEGATDAGACGPNAQDAARRKGASYADFLEAVLRAERRSPRAGAPDADAAGFPALKTLQAYDFVFATGAPRQQIQEVASLGFVERNGMRSPAIAYRPRARNAPTRSYRLWGGPAPAQLTRTFDVPLSVATRLL